MNQANIFPLATQKPKQEKTLVIVHRSMIKLLLPIDEVSVSNNYLNVGNYQHSKNRSLYIVST